MADSSIQICPEEPKWVKNLSSYFSLVWVFKKSPTNAVMQLLKDYNNFGKF